MLLGVWARCYQLLTVKRYHVTKYSHRKFRTRAVYWLFTSVRPKQQRRDLRFGKMKVRSLYRAGSVTAAARELARYQLYLVGMQEVRWNKRSILRAGDFNFFYKK